MVDQVVAPARYDDGSGSGSGTSVFNAGRAGRSNGCRSWSPHITHIVDLLVDFIPDLRDTSSLPDSAEYRAVEFLSLDNGHLFTKFENGTFLTEDIETLLQRYAMVVFYYEKGYDTQSTIDWLSAVPTCFWNGLECAYNDQPPFDVGTSIISLSISGKTVYPLSNILFRPLVL
jgi:hypothetical protein